MEVYTARQAILNRKNEVSAYELFFRSSAKNTFPASVDPHEATSKLIGRTYFNKGIQPFTNGKRALINFSEQSLLKRLPFFLPKDEIVIEILETVSPSDAIYELCTELYDSGYILALDDFIYKPQWKRFLSLVKIVKFDIQQTPLNTIAPLIEQLKNKTKIKLLAEKVETREEYEQAFMLGFHLFQGYYFCKPDMQKSQEMETNSILLIMLFNEINKPIINHNKIIEILERDCNLIFKLLCYVNSGIFPLQQKINSVKQAITYLGETQLKALITLFFTAILANDKPSELLSMSASRAKFCELIVNKTEPKNQESAFIVGMFSLIDAILDIPMHDITSRLSLNAEICDTLLDSTDTSQTNISMALRAIKYLEQGSWYLAEREAMKLKLPIAVLNTYYQTAIEWAAYIEECSLPEVE